MDAMYSYNSSVHFRERIFLKRFPGNGEEEVRSIWLIRVVSGWLKCVLPAKLQRAQFAILCIALSNFAILPPPTACKIWRGYLGAVLATAGPYSKRKFGVSFNELVAKAVYLFPEGPPHYGEVWTQVEGATIAMYNDFVMLLLKRTVILNLLVSPLFATIFYETDLIILVRSYNLRLKS